MLRQYHFAEQVRQRADEQKVIEPITMLSIFLRWDAFVRREGLTSMMLMATDGFTGMLMRVTV
jgi:hypothetical protein